ncbi:monocarboxylate transporter 12-like isoform X2 [Mercenaria mercenaria]|nr:monocarboxylate transporter 12-like isoform X2 [Mercenaria mercenaria]
MYMFVLGTMKSYGVLYTEMVEHFSSGSGNTAWIGSIAWFLLQGLGPVANLLSKRFTFRRVTIVGGIMLGSGYFLSGFVKKMELMYLTFTLCGIGYGLSFAPCATIISYYFKKRRALANGIVVSASGIGALSFPFLYRFLIDKYGLLQAFWIIGGVVCNICVAGCVFRQPIQLMKNRKEHESKDDTETETRVNGSDDSIASEKKSEIKHLKNTDMCGCGGLDLRLSLFKNRLFCMYVFAFTFSTFGHVNNTILIPAHVRDLGYDKTYVALSVSITGGAEVIARIFFGWFADLNIVRRKYIFAVCMFIGGIFSLITPLFDNFTYMAIYAAASATFPASFLSLISVLAIEIVGMDDFPSAFGLITLFMAFASVINQPICGWLRDYYGNWHISFILTGVTLLCSGVTVLLEPLIMRCSTRQKYKVTDGNEFGMTSEEGLDVDKYKKLIKDDSLSVVDTSIRRYTPKKYINEAFENSSQLPRELSFIHKYNV